MGIEYQKKKNHPHTGNLSTSMLEIDMFVDKRTKKFTTFFMIKEINLNSLL